MDGTRSALVNRNKRSNPKSWLSDASQVSVQPTHLKGRLLVKHKSLTLNQPYLWYSYVSNHLFIHINKGVTLGVAIEDTEGGHEIDILGRPRNGSAGNDGGLGRRHVERMRWRC